jgi:hypothetical protein
MKRNTPLITLLAGAVLGLVLLIASVVANPKAPASSAAADSPAAVPASSAPAATPTVTASAQPSGPQQATRTLVPAKADYAGEVQGGTAAIAISVHGTKAIAYLCNGASMDAWMTGSAINGHLTLNGKNGAHLDAVFDSKGTTGTAVVDGTSFQLPLQTERLTVQKQKDAGLFRATGMVGGKKVKAGWIVLQNGKTIGSIETSPDSPAPPTARAPALDLATLTARDGATVLVATHVSGAAGTGF